MDLHQIPGVIVVAAYAKFGAPMRAINNLADVQIVLKDLLDKKDRDLAKAKDQRGLQIKNAGDATDPQDLVTLRQLTDAISKIKPSGGSVTNVTSSGTGGVGPPGPPGPAGAPGTTITAALEVPVGTMNSVNTVFVIQYTPVFGTLILQLNGVTQKLTVEYTLAGTTITFIAPPKSDDWMIAQYFYN